MVGYTYNSCDFTKMGIHFRQFYEILKTLSEIFLDEVSLTRTMNSTLLDYHNILKDSTKFAFLGNRKNYLEQNIFTKAYIEQLLIWLKNGDSISIILRHNNSTIFSSWKHLYTRLLYVMESVRTKIARCGLQACNANKDFIAAFHTQETGN